MFKKTFYAFLALGAMIIIGSVTSGFISANTATETTVEAETLFADTWLAGTVAANGSKKDAGTGNWTATRNYTGVYTLQGPSNAGVFVVTAAANEPGTNGYTASVVSYGNGKYMIFTVDSDGIEENMDFSFVMYAR